MACGGSSQRPFKDAKRHKGPRKGTVKLNNAKASIGIPRRSRHQIFSYASVSVAGDSPRCAICGPSPGDNWALKP